MIYIYNKIIFSPEQINNICETYKNGISTSIIAEEYNVTHKTILNILRKNNIKIRNSGTKKGKTPWNKTKLNQETIDLICSVYNNGKSQEEVSKQLNVPLSSVNRTLKDNNIKFKTLSEVMIGKHNSPKTQFKEGQHPWNYGLTKETDERIKSYGKIVSKVKKGTPVHTEKHKKELSLKMSGSGNPMYDVHMCGENHPNYGKSPPVGVGHCKGTYYNSPLQGRIWIRSSWEVLYAMFLDEHKILWTYEPESFYITLVDGTKTSYHPDFYLIDYDIYIDVKGRKDENAKQIPNKEKIEQFKKEYPNLHIQVLFEKDLLGWGIDTSRNNVKVIMNLFRTSND